MTKTKEDTELPIQVNNNESELHEDDSDNMNENINEKEKDNKGIINQVKEEKEQSKEYFEKLINDKIKVLKLLKQNLKDILNDSLANKLLMKVFTKPDLYINDNRITVKNYAITLKEYRDLQNKKSIISKENNENILNKLNKILNYIKEKEWKAIGILKDFDELIKKYPSTKYEYGMKVNTIGPNKVIINHWNRGIRIIIDKLYLQGDNISTLKFGTSLFTRGLDNHKDKQNWYHHYFQFNGDKYAGNAGNGPLGNENSNSNGAILYARVR